MIRWKRPYTPIISATNQMWRRLNGWWEIHPPPLPLVKPRGIALSNSEETEVVDDSLDTHFHAVNAEVQRQWKREFQTRPPTRLTIARLCDKFYTQGTIYDVHRRRSGRPLTNHKSCLFGYGFGKIDNVVTEVCYLICTWDRVLAVQVYNTFWKP